MGRELPQGTTVGRCTVERLRERHGLSEVYAAVGQVGQACRLSFFHVDPDGQPWRRFVAESQQLGALNHPCLAEVLETAVTPDGRPYQVVSLGPGEDLASRLRRSGALTMPEALTVAQQVGAALHSLHALDLIHRGLSPERIFLCEGGDAVRPRVRLLDAGVTRLLDDSAAGALLGNPEYKAPEQLIGFSIDVGPAADLYALALLVYQSLTSSRPFKSDSAAGTILQVVRGTAEPLRALRPDLPRGVETAVMRALAKERTARYASVAEFLLALQGGEPLDESLDALVGGWLRSADAAQVAIRQAQAQADSKPSFQVVALNMGGGAVPEIVEDQATVPNTMDEVMRLAVPVEQISIGAARAKAETRAAPIGTPSATQSAPDTKSQPPDNDKTDENVKIEATGPLSVPAAPSTSASLSVPAAPSSLVLANSAPVAASVPTGSSPTEVSPSPASRSSQPMASHNIERLILLLVGVVLGFLLRHLTS